MSEEDTTSEEDEKDPTCEVGTCNAKPVATCGECGFNVCGKEHHLSMVRKCKRSRCVHYVCSQDRPKVEDLPDAAVCISDHEKYHARAEPRRAPIRKAATAAASAAAGGGGGGGDEEPPSKDTHRRAPKRKAPAASAAAGGGGGGVGGDEEAPSEENEKSKSSDAEVDLTTTGGAAESPARKKTKKAFETFPFRFNAAKANKEDFRQLKDIVADGCGNMPDAWQDVIQTALAQLFRLSPDTKLSIQKDATREYCPLDKLEKDGPGKTMFRFNDLPNGLAYGLSQHHDLTVYGTNVFLGCLTAATTHPLRQQYKPEGPYPLDVLLKSMCDLKIGNCSDELLASMINESIQALVSLFNKTGDSIPETCNKVYHRLVHSTSFLDVTGSRAHPVYTVRTVDDRPRRLLKSDEVSHDSVECYVITDVCQMIESALKLMYLTGSDVFTKDTHKQLSSGANDFIMKNTRHLADPLSPELRLRRVLQFFTLVPCIDVKRLGFDPLDLYRFVVQVIAPEMQEYKGAKSTKAIKVFPFGRIRRCFGRPEDEYPPWVFGAPLVSVEEYEPSDDEDPADDNP